MWLEHLEYPYGEFEFNGALGTQWSTWGSWSLWKMNRSYEKGMDLLRKEHIKWKGNDSSKKRNGAPISGMEHHGAWMRHNWSRCAILCMDAPLKSQGVPLMDLDMALSDAISHQVTWYATKWHDMPRSDLICPQVTWYAIKRKDMPPSDMICHSLGGCTIVERMCQLGV